MPKSDYLTITIPNLEERLGKFVAKIRDDKGALARFGREPAGAIVSEIVPEYRESISDTRLSVANRFLQSALANEKFRTWARQYQQQLRDRLAQGELPAVTLDKRKTLEDIAAALIESGDKQLIADWSDHLLASPQSRSLDSVVVTDDIAVVTKGIALLLVVITAIDVTPRAPSEMVRPAEIRSLADAIVNSAAAARNK